MAARIRLGRLRRGDLREGLYRLRDRNGLGVVVAYTASFSEEELLALMRYRLAQYLHAHFVDAGHACDCRLEHEPLSNLAADDVHVIVGSPETGEIYCYVVVEAPPPNVGQRLRDDDRPLLPVERVHGWGIFNRLAILPELPVGKVRELGRFAKNSGLPRFSEESIRSPVEAGVAVFRTLTGPLRLDVEALVGDFEPTVAKRNMDFFHVPVAVVRGTVPYEPESSYFFPRYQGRAVYPFAALSSDASIARLEEIEEALEQPGDLGLMALARLAAAPCAASSSFERQQGADVALTAVDIAQAGLSMPDRQGMLERARWLRRGAALRRLSVAEAALLGTMMQREEFPAGTLLARRGELGDAVYFIESGEAQMRMPSAGGDSCAVAEIGAGDHFGEEALFGGSSRVADVVATTQVVMARLAARDYERYLARLGDVDRTLARTAAQRALAIANQMAGQQPKPVSGGAPGKTAHLNGGM